MAHCMVVLCRLSTLEDPAWDLTLVRKTLNLSLVLDQLASNMAQVEAAASIDTTNYDGQSIYGQCAKRMLNIKEWWEGRLASETSGGNPAQHGVNGTMGPMAMDGVDDAWFMDMLGAWDYPFDAYGGYGAPVTYGMGPGGLAPT